jgi:hypothetical protein
MRTNGRSPVSAHRYTVLLCTNEDLGHLRDGEQLGRPCHWRDRQSLGPGKCLGFSLCRYVSSCARVSNRRAASALGGKEDQPP